jgi:hypothetical protein
VCFHFVKKAKTSNISRQNPVKANSLVYYRPVTAGYPKEMEINAQQQHFMKRRNNDLHYWRNVLFLRTEM